MDLNKAKTLVKAKFEDEVAGKSEGPIAEKYRAACRDFPAVMAVAHHHMAMVLK